MIFILFIGKIEKHCFGRIELWGALIVLEKIKHKMNCSLETKNFHNRCSCPQDNCSGSPDKQENILKKFMMNIEVIFMKHWHVQEKRALLYFAVLRNKKQQYPYILFILEYFGFFSILGNYNANPSKQSDQNDLLIF